MDYQASSKIDDQIVMSRAHVATELFGGIIASTKDVLEKVFKKPVSSYYDGEKKNVLLIAKTIFEYSVTPEDIDRLSKNMTMPEVFDATSILEESPSEDGSTACSDSDCMNGEGYSI